MVKVRGEPGKVLEALPHCTFMVRFADDRTVFCYLAGKMWQNNIRVLIGDRVEVVLSPIGDRGRIIKRI